MKQYLILLKGKKPLGYSPEELQKRMQEYRDWVNELGVKHQDGERLEWEGTHIIDHQTIHTDGPFLEAKEIIAGFFKLHCQSLEEATQVAASCPLLQYFEIYVRPVAK